MSWTDERVSVLKKLWGEGHTAAEIAKQLGGVTRNAVIGKAHRLKLSNRVSPIQQNKKPANANKRIEKKPVEKAKTVTVKTKEAVSKVVVEEKKVNPEDLYSLMDLQPRQCRWPSGDPKEKDFGFCGEKSMAGLPYCAEHAKVAYQASTRNRLFNETKPAVKTEEQQKAAS